MFRFTISTLALFLGKSPVTIRAWERKKLLKLPRVGSDRSVTLNDIYAVALKAQELGRIDNDRLWLIKDALLSLQAIEQENEVQKEAK